MPNQFGMSRKCKTLNTYIGWTSYYVYALLSIQCKKKSIFCVFMCFYCPSLPVLTRHHHHIHLSVCLFFALPFSLTHLRARARAVLFPFAYLVVWLLISISVFASHHAHSTYAQIFSIYIYIKRCRKLNCRCSWFELSSWFLGRFRRWTLLTAYNVHHTLRLY